METKMRLEERQSIYKRVLQKMGFVFQLEMAQEEATEFALAIRRHIRKGTNKSYHGLVGEIADIKIMIEQLEYMFSRTGIQIEIEQLMEFKLQRLDVRLRSDLMGDSRVDKVTKKSSDEFNGYLKKIVEQATVDLTQPITINALEWWNSLPLQDLQEGKGWTNLVMLYYPTKNDCQDVSTSEILYMYLMEEL